MLNLQKRYMFLFGTSYSNIFNDICVENIIGVFPRGEAAFPEQDQEYLREVFGSQSSLVDYTEHEMLRLIKSYKPDVLLSLGWRRILKKSILESVQQCINIHPAILPYYRGYHTEPYVIINNEREHGITAHVLTPELDAGPIIMQKRFAINEFSTVKSIKQSVVELMPSFLYELFGILEVDKITYSENDPSKTKIVAPKRKPSDSEINPARPLVELYHYIRACDPEKFPAHFYFNGTKILIKMWRERLTKTPDDYEL